MPGFRWELQQDIALASEVATSHPQKLQDWDEITVTLSAAFSSDVNSWPKNLLRLKRQFQYEEIHVSFIAARKVGVSTFL